MDISKVDQQRELYGEALGVLVGRIREALGLNQSEVSRVVGLSPAMLSQLVTGQRVKIANPLAVARLQSLLDLADEAPDLPRAALAQRLEEIRDSRTTLSSTSSGSTTRSTYTSAMTVRGVLQAVASGAELHAAAAALDDLAPGLAEVLRVYGTGAPHDAEAHLRSIAPLISSGNP